MSRMFIPHIITDDSALGGNYDIERSATFIRADQNYWSRTPSSASNQRTYTISCWYKRTALTYSIGNVFEAKNNGQNYQVAFFRDDDKFEFHGYTSSGGNQYTSQLVTAQKFRDISNWFHIVIAVDTTQGTASNRIKIYINGSQVTDFTTANYPSQNLDTFINSTQRHDIGRGQAGSAQAYDGYMSEINFVDGQQLAPTEFGYNEFQTNIWKPIKYRGTYGTNGFYLNFSDLSNGVTTMGYDQSGRGNNWTPNNFSTSTSTHNINNDSVTDTPTNNFPVWNNLRIVYGGSVSRANLYQETNVYQSYPEVWASMGMTQGKWYCELYVTGGANGPTVSGGIKVQTMQPASDGGPGVGYQNPPDSKGTYGGASPGYGNGTLMGIAYDADIGLVTFYKNGSVYGSTAHDDVDTTKTWFYGAAGYSYNPDNDRKIFYNANFGQKPFSYTPPTGYVALCQKNLDLLTINTTDVSSEGQGSVVLRPQRFFDTVLYTGNGGTNNITDLEFAPDFVWIKVRSNAGDNHHLYDTVRGAAKTLFSNTTAAEQTSDTDRLSSFNGNGFTLGSNYRVNGNSRTFVAWCWKAGGTSVANNDGAIASTVNVNKEAGFSIVGFQPTAASTAVTVGHGLGVAPHMIIVKSRGSSANWDVFHNSPGSSLGAGNKLYLNGTNSQISSGAWGSTLPTTSVFTFNPGSQNNNNHIAYCWHSVPGYSKIGVYRANGNANGPYEHTGFKPAWIMIKNQSNSSAPWYIIDNKRSPHNERKISLKPNTTDAEATDSNFIDFYSMGFKLRTSGSYVNGGNSTDRIIYMAFAEQSGRNEFGTFANAG